MVIRCVIMLSTWIAISTTKGEKSKAPVLGKRLRIGSMIGRVRPNKSGIIGAVGFTQDKITWIKIIHNEIFKTHLIRVNTAAKATLGRISKGTPMPVISSQPLIKYKKAQIQAQSRLAVSRWRVFLRNLWMGTTAQSVTLKIPWEYGLNGGIRIKYSQALNKKTVPSSERMTCRRKDKISVNILASNRVILRQCYRTGRANYQQDLVRLE